MHEKNEQIEQPYKYLTDEPHRRGVVDDLVWEWKVGCRAVLRDNCSWAYLVDHYVYTLQLKKLRKRKSLTDRCLVSCHVEGKEYKIQWGDVIMTRQELEKAFFLLMEILSEIDRKLVEKAKLEQEWLQAYAQAHRPKAVGES